MVRRVFWKKGMRLTDELLRLSDKCTTQQIANALTLAASGRFGLITSARPFSLSIESNGSYLEVINLSCFAVTPDGSIIDVDFDSNYNLGFSSRVPIHQCDPAKRYLLLISLSNEDWSSTNDSLCEPVYRFSVIEENSRLQPTSFPIARLICESGAWRVDEIDFVPPCLFVSSCDKFVDLAIEFQELLRSTEQLLPQRIRTQSGVALQIMWPRIQDLMITMDRCCDLMTPMALYGNVQKYVSAYVCASMLDDMFVIENPEYYQQYVHNPYNYRDVYTRIREGLVICASIRSRVESFEPQEPRPVKVEVPRIPVPQVDASMLSQVVRRNMVTVPVTNLPADGILYYSVNGSSETRATANKVQLNPRFLTNNSIEAPKVYSLCLSFEVNGERSEIANFQLTVEKDHFKWIII